MACKHIEEIITINDKEIKLATTQWSAEQALINKFKVIKVFGSSLSKMIVVDFTDPDSIKNIGSVLSEVFEYNQPEKVVELFKDIIIIFYSCCRDIFRYNIN